jgi:hypothetical protein
MLGLNLNSLVSVFVNEYIKLLEWKETKIAEFLKPRNFLNLHELIDVMKALDALELPKPTGWAHALHVHSIRNIRESFSADRAYCEGCLTNLIATLHQAGLKNKEVFRKLENMKRVAKRFGIKRCIHSLEREYSF